jgi:hypothetical protein
MTNIYTKKPELRKNLSLVSALFMILLMLISVYGWSQASGNYPSLSTGNRDIDQVTAATYTWQGIDSASWIVSTNWDPERTTPATDDILQFNDGTTKAVTNVPAQTIGQLIFSTSTTVVLQSTAAVTLTIGGGTGTDLVIPSGSALNITQATNAIYVTLSTGATGSIAGSMTFSTAPHKLQAADASGITFESGAVFTTGTGFSSNAFGNTYANSIVFANGSSYVHTAGSNPFALTQPASVVVFQAGSLYKAISSTTPAFSGRTYANFEMDAVGVTLTTTGGSAVSINNLTITNGTLNFNMTATPGHSIKGDISVANGATLNFNPATAGTVNLNGTAAQTISGAGTINSSGTLSTINIANASGVILNAAAKFNNLSIGSGTFTVASGASLITTGTVTGSVIVERSIGAWTDALHGWHLLSSPVASQAIDPAFTDGTPANYDFYKWDESTDMWLTQKLPANAITSFGPGTGYLVAYAAVSTKQFNGALNTTSVPVSGLTSSGGANSGWNLLGNPFSCALTWGTANWLLTNVTSTAKIWQESSASYVDIPATTGIIPAMNGFMVETSGAGSLIIPISDRVHSATAWYKDSEGYIKLIASDPVNSTSQESIIKVNANATEGFDKEFDSHFLAGYAPQFYSIAGDESLSTNTLPNLDNGRVIEMGFVKNGATEFSIGLNTEYMIPGMVVYLTDKKTGVVTELTQNEYTFNASDGDDANRFLLHFSALGIDDPSVSETYSIYSHAGNIYIASQQAVKADVMVSNLLGQVVMHCQTNGNNLTALNASALHNGVYMVTVISGSQVVSRKVLINR